MAKIENHKYSVINVPVPFMHINIVAIHNLSLDFRRRRNYNVSTIKEKEKFHASTCD